MAYSYGNFLVILAFLLIATTAPKAHGFLYNGENVAAIVVKGELGCTSTGNPTPGCQLLASVPVTLTYIGSSLLPVFHTTTLSDGSFSFLIADLTAVAALPLATVLAELSAAVNLIAVTNCAALPSTGYLRSPVNQNSAAATQGSAAGITLVVHISGFTYSAA